MKNYFDVWNDSEQNGTDRTKEKYVWNGINYMCKCVSILWSQWNDNDQTGTERIGQKEKW